MDEEFSFKHIVAALMTKVTDGTLPQPTDLLDDDTLFDYNHGKKIAKNPYLQILTYPLWKLLLNQSIASRYKTANSLEIDGKYWHMDVSILS